MTSRGYGGDSYPFIAVTKFDCVGPQDALLKHQEVGVAPGTTNLVRLPIPHGRGLCLGWVSVPARTRYVADRELSQIASRHVCARKIPLWSLSKCLCRGRPDPVSSRATVADEDTLRYPHRPIQHCVPAAAWNLVGEYICAFLDGLGGTTLLAFTFPCAAHSSHRSAYMCAMGIHRSQTEAPPSSRHSVCVSLTTLCLRRSVLTSMNQPFVCEGEVQGVIRTFFRCCSWSRTWQVRMLWLQLSPRPWLNEYDYIVKMGWVRRR